MERWISSGQPFNPSGAHCWPKTTWTFHHHVGVSQNRDPKIQNLVSSLLGSLSPFLRVPQEKAHPFPQEFRNPCWLNTLQFGFGTRPRAIFRHVHVDAQIRSDSPAVGSVAWRALERGSPRKKQKGVAPTKLGLFDSGPIFCSASLKATRPHTWETCIWVRICLKLPFWGLTMLCIYIYIYICIAH